MAWAGEGIGHGFGWPRNGFANLSFVVGEKTDSFSNAVGDGIVQFGYRFTTEPTTISNVKVVKLTGTSAVITWKTNHPATGKVNYGVTEDFGQDVQSTKRVTEHEFTITHLAPNTAYFYEVMSQSKDYIYDAKHEFRTSN